MKRTGVALLFAVLALSGCAASTPAPTSSASTTKEEPRESALERLRVSYVEAGGQCDTITLRNTSVAEEAGDCDDGALLTTYRSTVQRDSAISVIEGLQDTNPSPHVIAVGSHWIVNGGAAESVAASMGGATRQIGTPTIAPAPRATSAPEDDFDLTTDTGLCEADGELTNLELNDAIAPLLGFPADRDARSFEQDEAIREYKNAAFQRACPARAG